jgi:hypothetical protein
MLRRWLQAVILRKRSGKKRAIQHREGFAIGGNPKGFMAKEVARYPPSFQT